MKWLFIIDPIESLNTETDTTYAIIKEAFERGTDCHIAGISDLYFKEELFVRANEIKFKNDKFELSKESRLKVDKFDFIFMRKEPPYDLPFHYAVLLLSLTKRPVVNSPQAMRDFNEKLIILNFPDLTPKTLVSSDIEAIIDFMNDASFVIKALESYQGKVVKKIRKDDKDFIPTLKEWTKAGPVMVQEFLTNIDKGDKRILMLGGEIIGAVNRIPRQGSFISNFGQGGLGVKSEITDSDRKIAERIKGFLLEHGLHFVGLDIIDGYLTEINITCPTGLQHINRLENRKLEKEVVDYFARIIHKLSGF